MKTAQMNLKEVLAQLEAWGSESTRKIYARQSAGENLFGVTLGNLRGLAKKLKTNHLLALELWDSGNVDAMILATMLLDPSRLSVKQIESMLKPLAYYRLIDEFTYNAVAKSACADALRVRWMDSPKEMIGRAGWNLSITRITHGETDGLDFAALLKQIEAEILAAPKRKQESMNCCLVMIGIHMPKFTEKCVKQGERLGRFDKTPVPKGCVSTYAPEWIAASLARKK